MAMVQNMVYIVAIAVVVADPANGWIPAIILISVLHRIKSQHFTIIIVLMSWTTKGANVEMIELPVSGDYVFFVVVLQMLVMFMGLHTLSIKYYTALQTRAL